MPNEQQRQQRTSRSRLSLATAAIRPGMKGRMMISGPSGAGKTYTAELIARILVGTEGRILHIDTEKDSAKTYADEFDFDHLPFQAPYDATDLAMTLREASGVYDAVIVDSFTHFWRGQGGILDTASGRWTGWKEARPMHADVIDAVLTIDAHVLLCCRSKQEHVQVKDEHTGKIEVRKLGMKAQQDDDLEYEVNVAVEMDMSHIIHVSKSRTRAVPVGTEFISGHAEEFGGVYRDWLSGGEPVAGPEATDRLIEVLNSIEDPANRQRAKVAFLDTFGRPEFLLESRLPDAQEWVADRLLGNDEPPDRGPDETPAERAPSQDTTHERGDDHDGARVAGGDPTPGDEARERVAAREEADAAGIAAAVGSGNACAWRRSPVRLPENRCGHDETIHDIEGRCTGIHVAGVPNTSDAVEVPCQCPGFVPFPAEAAPAAPSAPEVAPEGPTAPDGAQGAEEGGSEALARAQIEAEVEAMTLSEVGAALLAAKRSGNGSPKHLRQRLVDTRLKGARSAPAAVKEPML